MTEQLDAVQNTLFTPLYARAHAADVLPRAGFTDPAAAAMLARIGTPPVRTLTDRSNVAGAVYRALILDQLTTHFATAHPDGLILTVGIGLCTRRERLATTVPGTVRWVGVDTPPVVAVRRSRSADSGTELVGASIADPSWAAQVTPGSGPTLVIAEGVLMYLDSTQLGGFLHTVRTRFGAGTQLAADYFHPAVARSDRHPIVKATGARFRSGARNAAGLAAADPGWRPLGEYDVMARISPLHHIAALAFRAATRGARPYGVAHLVTQPTAT